MNDDASFDACERIMATNYFGVVAGTLAVMSGMLRRGDGIIVNVSSDSARAPEAGGGEPLASCPTAHGGNAVGALPHL